MALNVATLVARVVADTSGFNRGMAGVESRLAATGAGMQRTGRMLTNTLTLPLLVAAGAGVKFAIDFQRNMELIHTQAGAAQSEVDKMSKAVLSLAPATAFGPNELAKALYHIESVGDRGAKAMTVLKVAAQGAAVGGSDLEDTASALVGTMRVFHVGADGAGKIMATLNAIVGAGNMRMQDLNQAISTGLLPTSKGLGISLSGIGAALATMTDESVPAQVAATRMRTLLLLMSGETKKSRDTLAELGIKQDEIGRKLRQPGGMIPALQDLRDHLHKLDPTSQVRVLAQAFGGARSAGTIIQLLNNLNMVQQKFDQINKTAANFPEAVLRTQQTDSYKLHQAWAAIQTVLIQIGGIISPVVVKIAQAISSIALAFGKLPQSMQTLIVGVGAVIAALGPLLWIGGTLLTVFEALASPVGLVAVGLVGLAVGAGYLYTHVSAVHNAVKGFFDLISGTAPRITADMHHHMDGMQKDFFEQRDSLTKTQQAWRAIAPGISGALSTIRQMVSAVSKFVVQQWNAMKSGIMAHSKEIEAFLRVSWRVIQAVFQAVMPILRIIVTSTWDTIKVTIQTAMRVIGNVILAIMDIISGNWAGAWHAMVAATRALVSGIVQVIGIGLRAAIGIARAAATAIGRAIWAGVKAGAAALANLMGYLIGLIGAAIRSTANWAASVATAIGSAIVSGIMSGIGSLPGQLAGKLHSMIAGAIHAAGSALHGSGEYMATKHLIGHPLARGVVEGYLVGIRDLPNKIKDSVRNALEVGQRAVQAAQTRLGAAWQRLSDYAMRAFDARTQQHLDKMKANFDALIKSKVTDPLEAALKAAEAHHQENLGVIAFGRQMLTPAEDQLRQLQEAHDAAGRQQAIEDAQQALSTAQAEGDPEAVKQAQQQLADALYQDQIANLQRQADLERTAADNRATTAEDKENDRYDAQKVALQAQYDAVAESLQKVYDRQVLEYQAQRDLLKQHLQDQLDAMGEALQKHPELWKKYYHRVLRMFKDDFGPGMKTAGHNLGAAFATGLRESLGDVGGAAEYLAHQIAKYLKIRSPADLGPLSDLDTWWRGFGDTLVSGLDISSAENAAAALAAKMNVAPPGVPMSLAPGVGMPSSGGATIIQVSFPGAVLLGRDKSVARELAQAVKPELDRIIGIS